jgi:hypothetical protein
MLRLLFFFCMHETTHGYESPADEGSPWIYKYGREFARDEGRYAMVFENRSTKAPIQIQKRHPR